MDKAPILKISEQDSPLGRIYAAYIEKILEAQRDADMEWMKEHYTQTFSREPEKNLTHKMKGEKITAWEVNEYGRRYIQKPIPITAVPIKGDFWVESLKGNHQGKDGDYAVVGIKGEIYIVDKEIFEETYSGYVGRNYMTL